MRKPFKKNINEVEMEEAHGGSGKRQVLLSQKDDISTYMEAMTKGYIPPKGAYDWHSHDGVDELFLVLQGRGTIEFEDGISLEYAKDDLVHIPADIKHRIENTSETESEFLFIRIKH